MITFGERLKQLRKSKKLGQMELAEQIGVSVQSVSRWETGNCMPDIFQIVPLAKVLGTTADHLLGMDFPEEDEISKARKELSRLHNLRSKADRTEGNRDFEINKKCYDILAPLAVRYPMNYTLLLQCCMMGSYHLTDIVKGKHFNYTEKEINSLYNDLERMLSTVIAYEKNLGLKQEAKEHLVRIHCIMGYYGKAEMEAEDLGYIVRYKMLCEIAEAQGKENESVVYAKKSVRCELREYYLSLVRLAFSYSAQGKPMRHKALEVWEKALELLKAQKSVFGIGLYNDFIASAYSLIAKEYLRDGQLDKCLDYIEALTDECVYYYQWIKDNVAPDGRIMGEYDDDTFLYSGILESLVFTKDETLVRSKNALKWCVLSCCDEYDDKENNPIVTSERFKRCIERFDSLN